MYMSALPSVVWRVKYHLSCREAMCRDLRLCCRLTATGMQIIMRARMCWYVALHWRKLHVNNVDALAGSQLSAACLQQLEAVVRVCYSAQQHAMIISMAHGAIPCLRRATQAAGRALPAALLCWLAATPSAHSRGCRLFGTESTLAARGLGELCFRAYWPPGPD